MLDDDAPEVEKDIVDGEGHVSDTNKIWSTICFFPLFLVTHFLFVQSSLDVFREASFLLEASLCVDGNLRSKCCRIRHEIFFN